MSSFDNYFLMKADDVKSYCVKKLHYFEDEKTLCCEEIGDGNINYIFRVADTVTGRSVIVKQAGSTTRISKDIYLSTDRNRIEYEILSLQGKAAPGLVPEVYMYDGEMHAMAMQDLTGHTIMRTALMQRKKLPRFADDITTFMVNTLLLSTDVAVEHKEKKARVKSFINPQLCEITEDLVYTEPYNDRMKRNNLFAPNMNFVQRNIYNDSKLHLEVTKLKFDFMNNSQALIHGDLHTGSVFVTPESTYIFDPEFAFYGPMGYDVGNIVANLFFAWCNTDAIDDAPDYKLWLEGCITDVVDLFISKFKACFSKNCKDPMATVDGFQEWYLNSVLSDTAGVTGLELNRKIVGMANVKDIITIKEDVKRARAERICLLLGKKCILERAHFTCGKAYIDALNEVLQDSELKF